MYVSPSLVRRSVFSLFLVLKMYQMLLALYLDVTEKNQDEKKVRFH